ncbi:MAG: DUF4337 domain-containing protein [Beijerinckiaceae bacterium]|jgi:hypothetical protein|nr:DUF4337 domain-containing protein [Beijerinckiaceae bacterium]
MSGAPDIPDGNKRIGLLIAVLALMLAFSEMGNKQAEAESVAKNIEAANLWSFFQAKTIRRTSTLVAAEDMQTRLATVTDPAVKAAYEAQIKRWRDTAARYESEPETNEGRKELIVRAKAAEERRDLQKVRSEVFEISSALIQIGIVLASAAVITGIGLLVWCAGGLGIGALVLMGFGTWAPTAVPFIS